jgi:3-oxoacyl-[acyl-carrier-protein] synthase-1/3-oxoacyl-[acyl-carrier-protein] synthase II
MTAAIEAAGMTPDQIGYVNLHGTGTRENDLAEARALRRVFGKRLPPLSSVKGATGHGLGASGAIEAVISALTVSRGMIPGTPGFRQADPELGLTPVTTARQHPVASVLSNSLGFGGNNAAIVISASSGPGRPMAPIRPPALTVLSSACLSGAGGTARTLACLQRGDACRGVYLTESISQGLGHRAVRRLRRLPRMALALAADACGGRGPAAVARAVFFGTGWGALSETHNFLDLLFQSDERFSSPTDFIGSVHNAPAGQVALNLGATGANLTLTAGDVSFEQALFCAALLSSTVEGSLLVMGADEYHAELSARFDPSVAVGGLAADGGGAFCLSAEEQATGPKIETVFLGSPRGEKASVGHLIEALGGAEAVSEGFAVVLAGIPAAVRRVGLELLDDFRGASRFGGPIVDYRRLTGEFATASALASAVAARWMADGRIPGALCGGRPITLCGKGILLLGLGECLAAVTLKN